MNEELQVEELQNLQKIRYWVYWVENEDVWTVYEFGALKSEKRRWVSINKHDDV